MGSLLLLSFIRLNRFFAAKQCLLGNTEKTRLVTIVIFLPHQ